MQEACDAVQLKWVLRRGLAILNTLEVSLATCPSPVFVNAYWFPVLGIPTPLNAAQAKLDAPQIEDNPQFFQTNIKAGGIMDVVERYPWTGEEKQHSRRDKRAGHHNGRIVKTDKGPSIQYVSMPIHHYALHAEL